eukprot:12930681-Prorocentrum_lima.AAC.1
MHKEGSIPSEKRMALDVYDIRQYLATDDVLWTSIADSLTKHIAIGSGEASPLQSFFADRRDTPVDVSLTFWLCSTTASSAFVHKKV